MLIHLWAEDTVWMFSAPVDPPNRLLSRGQRLEAACTRILPPRPSSNPLTHGSAPFPSRDMKVLGLGVIFFLLSNVSKVLAKIHLCPLHHPHNPRFFSQTLVSLFLIAGHTMTGDWYRTYPGSGDKLTSLIGGDLVLGSRAPPHLHRFFCYIFVKFRRSALVHPV